MMLSVLTLEHGGRDVEVVIGEAAFRKQMERLIQASLFWPVSPS